MSLAIADSSGKLKVRIPATGEDVLTQILLSIAHKGVIRASYKKLKRNTALNQGKILEVADAILPYDRDDMQVQIVEEGYQARLRYAPTAKCKVPPTFFEMLWIVVHNHVVFGIKFDELDRIATEHDFGETGEWTVAEGKRHVPGRSAQIEYHVSTEVSRAPLVLVDGRVDYRKIDAVKLVAQDQKLATKHPATSGMEGVAVTGRTIPVEPGRDAQLPMGENTYVDEDARTLLAKVAGHLYVSNGLLNVEKVLIIKSSVDYSTGNLEFAGDVVVMGGVIAGFSVEAEGNVFVKGSVDAARVVARKGGIEVMGGVFGNGQAELVAGRSLRLEFADQARICAGEDVVVNKYLTHCQTTAGKAVQVHGISGTIIGGRTQAGERILAAVVGSETTGRTVLTIQNREGEVDALALEQVDADIARMDEQLREAERAAAMLAQLKGDLSSLTPSQRAKVTQLARAAPEHRAQRAGLLERKAALVQRRNRLKFDAIRVEREIFPGTEIVILGVLYHVGKRLAGTIFGLSEEGQITLNK